MSFKSISSILSWKSIIFIYLKENSVYCDFWDFVSTTNNNDKRYMLEYLLFDVEYIQF